mgnify:CR=1 FL=1
MLSLHEAEPDGILLTLKEFTHELQAVGCDSTLMLLEYLEVVDVQGFQWAVVAMLESSKARIRAEGGVAPMDQIIGDSLATAMAFGARLGRRGLM